MALSKKEIESTILAKGFKPHDITGYKNLSSTISVQCNKGHTFNTDMKMVRSDKFACPHCIGEATSALPLDLKIPPKQGYRIVAIDQASHNVGISVFDNGKLVHYHFVEITGGFDVRLYKLHKFLVEVVIKQWVPDYLVFEDIQYQDNAMTHKTLGMVMGVCVLAAVSNNIDHSEILNKVWQAEFGIAGSTRIAQKTNVIKRVKEYYKIDVTDDVADAILLGQYAAKKLSQKWEVKLF